MKKMIYVCSPYKPVSYSSAAQKLELARNKALAKYGCLTVVEKGGIPIAPHLFCTQFLDDVVPEERELGMELGLEMLIRCDEMWVFKNGPFSLGMLKELSEASAADIPIKIFHVDDVSHINNQGKGKDEEEYPVEDTDEEGGDAEEETNDASDVDSSAAEFFDEEEESGLTDDMLENFLCAIFGIGEEDKDEDEKNVKKAQGSREHSNEDTTEDDDDDFEGELPIEAVEASLNALLEYLADHEKKNGHRHTSDTGHTGRTEYANVKGIRIVKV